MHTLSIAPHSTLYFLGPKLDQGPLPALFYFALSGEESLTLSPYNQLPTLLSTYPLRIFSMTLPAHGPTLDPKRALATWAEQVEKGYDPFSPFIEEALYLLSYLMKNQWIQPHTTALAGLSRGAFFATHIAAKMPQIPYLLGLAPLTQLSFSQEFSRTVNHPLIHSLNLTHQIENLIHTHLRFYIGNHDTLVSTDLAFQFIRDLAEQAYRHRIRSPQAELLITPSIGHKGHGTSPETFQDAATWIATKLGVLGAK